MSWQKFKETSILIYLYLEIYIYIYILYNIHLEVTEMMLSQNQLH